jgi:hypothetical protein
VNSAKHWLARLNALDVRDRSWLLEQLPSAVKQKLLDAAQDPYSQQEPEIVLPDVQADASEQALNAASVDTVVQVLSVEPAWLTAVVLQVRQWSWQQEVLQRLPATLRLEIERHQAGLSGISVLMEETVVAAVLTRIHTQAAVSQPSRFDSLVRRVSQSRSRRRWSVAQ